MLLVYPEFINFYITVHMKARLCVVSDFDALLAGEVGGVEFGKLPFGACEDPIR